MGTWGTGLYSNDTTSDTKDIYIDLLKRQKDNETAYAEAKEMLAYVFGTEEEPLFWYALADTQWNIGRLMPEVKEKALMFINNKGGCDIWEGNLKNISKWEKNLKILEEKLNTPQPPEKTFPKAKDFVSNPWNIGDVYAYQFHTKKAIENGLNGKYILMQKIANVDWYEEKKCSAVRFFNKVFDYVPNIAEIDTIPVLPLCLGQRLDQPNESWVKPLEIYLQGTMGYEKIRDYPKKYLTFVGNS